MNLVDILFIVTVVLLVLNGLRNGALFSLLHLLTIPIAFAVAYMYGPTFTLFLASNGLAATPLIAYIVLFLGTALILHIIGSMIRGVIRAVPLAGPADSLLGGLLGFVEAWLLWLILLTVMGWFLGSAQQAIETGQLTLQGLDIHSYQTTIQQWHDFYNQAITDSIFAHVNGFFIKTLPALKSLTPVR